MSRTTLISPIRRLEADETRGELFYTGAVETLELVLESQQKKARELYNTPQRAFITFLKGLTGPRLLVSL